MWWSPTMNHEQSKKVLVHECDFLYKTLWTHQQKPQEILHRKMRRYSNKSITLSRKSWEINIKWTFNNRHNLFHFFPLFGVKNWYQSVRGKVMDRNIDSRSNIKSKRKIFLKQGFFLSSKWSSSLTTFGNTKTADLYNQMFKTRSKRTKFTAEFMEWLKLIIFVWLFSFCNV